MKKRAERARYSFPGALGGGRTHTGRILSPLPLPLGYEGGSCAEQSIKPNELHLPWKWFKPGQVR